MHLPVIDDFVADQRFGRLLATVAGTKYLINYSTGSGHGVYSFRRMPRPI